MSTYWPGLELSGSGVDELEPQQADVVGQRLDRLDLGLAPSASGVPPRRISSS